MDEPGEICQPVRLTALRIAPVHYMHLNAEDPLRPA